MSFIVIISNLDEEDDESEDDDDDLEVEDEDLEVDDEPVNQDYIQKNWHHSLHDKDYFRSPLSVWDYTFLWASKLVGT